MKQDFSDIYDLMAFFKGDIDGDGRDHDELADVMARAGHKWSLTFWRQEDMVAYMFRCVFRAFIASASTSHKFVPVGIQTLSRICPSDEC